MVIIDVTSQNFSDFYDLFAELMLEGYRQFPENLRNYFLARDYSKSNFNLWMERNFRKMMIAVEMQDSNRVKGFLIGDHTYGGVAFVSWLGVKKENRKQGIGSQLLKAYEDYVVRKKSHLIELFTSENNIPFYEKHGYQEIGRRKEGFYGQQNIIMNKPLGHFSESLIDLTVNP